MIHKRSNFIHTDHTALAYRSIGPPCTKPASYASSIIYMHIGVPVLVCILVPRSGLACRNGMQYHDFCSKVSDILVIILLESDI